jgi:hypothetical protein
MNYNLLTIRSLPSPVRIDSILIDGIDMEDAFDFCDAYASCALFEDGTPLSTVQLNILTDSDKGRELIYALACQEAVELRY